MAAWATWASTGPSAPPATPASGRSAGAATRSCARSWGVYWGCRSVAPRRHRLERLATLSHDRWTVAGLLLGEVLAEHRLLALIVGADVLAVEHVRDGCHPLERQLAHRLTVFDHERHIARAHLERRTRAVATLTL